MARYSDIERGPELADAYAKKQIWKAKSRAAKRTDYAAARSKSTTARWERVEGFILPFNVLSTTTFYETKILDPIQSITPDTSASTALALADDFISTLGQLPTTGVGVQKIPKYKFAKIICSDREGAGVNKNSRITDQPYLQYVTYNASNPIGRSRTTPIGSEFAEVVAAIKANALYAAFFNEPGRRISIIPERG